MNIVACLQDLEQRHGVALPFALKCDLVALFFDNRLRTLAHRIPDQERLDAHNHWELYR